MKLTEDKPELIITPDPQLAKKLVEEHIKSKGMYQLSDAIKEIISYSGYSFDDQSYEFNGIYPNHFQSHEEAKLFKESVESLVLNTNDGSGNFKVKNIDDVLFITYFFVGYDGDVYSSNANNKYLDDLVDVFMGMFERSLTPIEDNCIWVPDGVTGIEAQVSRDEFVEDELKMNGGYRLPPE